MTGSSGFLGRHLRGVLQKSTVQPLTLMRIGQDKSFDLAGRYTLVLSGGYSPASNQEFSTSQAIRAFYSLEQIFENPKLSIERVVLVSSVDAGLQASVENVQPKELYAKHKRDFESNVLGWAKLRNSPLAIIRVGPLYGPGEEHYQRLIPRWIDCAARGERIKFNGPADFSRPYLYVEDAAEVISSFTLDQFQPGLFEFVGAEDIGAKRIELAVCSALQHGGLKQKKIGDKPIEYSITQSEIILSSYTQFEEGILREIRARHAGSNGLL